MPRGKSKSAPVARRRPPGKQPGPPLGRVGERLFTLMRAQGVTQSELGRRAGVPQSRISDLICGRVQYPRVDRLRALAAALGQRPDALTEGLGLEVIRVHTNEGLVKAYDLATIDGARAA